MQFLEKIKNINEISIYFIVFFIIKLLLMFNIPLLDDEAYFITWGQSFELGYYDHPPMIGWIIWLLSNVSDSHLFLRLFPLATTCFISYLVYSLLSSSNSRYPKEISLLFFISLSSVFHVPTLNDTALLLFGAISFYYFLKDQISPSKENLPLSCLFMAIAFMAKYFAAFLGLVYLVVLIIKKRKDVFKYLLWTVIFVAPALYIQYSWNKDTCWNNIMFNVMNRHSGKSSFELFSFLASVAVFLNPFVFWYSLRKSETEAGSLSSFAKGVWLVSLVIFGLISLRTLVGAHWLLVFLIAPYLILTYLTPKQMTRLTRLSAGFSFLIVVVTFVFLSKAEDISHKRGKDYAYYQHFFHPEEICNIVKLNVPAGYHFMADGYSPASIFSNICGYPVPVIFHRGVYGRQSDFKMDFSKFDGKNIAIYTDIHDGSSYMKYFKNARKMATPLVRGNVKILLGEGFNFELYRKDILTNILDRYYRIPHDLPYGKCYFHDKYFPEVAKSYKK
jgi:hypothetical protein